MSGGLWSFYLVCAKLLWKLKFPNFLIPSQIWLVFWREQRELCFRIKWFKLGKFQWSLILLQDYVILKLFYRFKQDLNQTGFCPKIRGRKIFWLSKFKRIVKKWLMPYPCSHFYFDIFKREEESLASSLLNIICRQNWYQSKSNYMDRA